MKTGIKFLALTMALGLTGCVHTVTENRPGQLPAYRDRLEVRYQKPLDVVFEASKRALTSFGNITAEGKVYATTNEVRIVEGMVNGRSIYMRVEQIDPVVTSAIVQVRTSMGGTDLRIAKNLVQRMAIEME